MFKMPNGSCLMVFLFSEISDFNFEFKQNQSDRQPNVCEDQPRYSNSFRNVPSFNSNSNLSNGSSVPLNNGNRKPQRSTTMTTSSVNQSTQFESPSAANAFNRSPNNATNTQSSPTITGNSSSAVSTPSLAKSMSSDEAARTTPSNGVQSPSSSGIVAGRTTASTSANRTKPTCTKISELTKRQCCSDGNGSGCECSDDELIAKFRESYDRDQSLSPTATEPSAVATPTTTKAPSATSNVPKSKSNTDNLTCGSTSSNSTTKTGYSKDEPSSVLESSDISSFEDLGAVGGTTNTHTNTSNAPCASDTEKWQIVNPTWNIDDTASASSMVDDKTGGESTNGVSYTTNLPNSITELPQINIENESDNQRQQSQPQHHQSDASNDGDTFQQQQQQHSTSNEQPPTTELRSKLEKTLRSRQAHRKITRRQSDGIVYTASTSNFSYRTDRYLDDVDDDEDCSSTSDDVSSHKRIHKSCRKCGKTKGDLKKYIAKFRHQLETTTAFSETEIKQQLDAFLEFLENHSAFDSKDDDSIPNTVDLTAQSPSQFVAEIIELEEFEDDDDDDDDYDEGAGIHVYGSNDDDTNTSTHPPRQFFNLSSVEKK